MNAKKVSKEPSKKILKNFQKAFTNYWKHDIINISNETKTKNKLKERRD